MMMMVCLSDIAITLHVRVGEAGGALLEIRMGDHTVALSDWWRRGSGLKIEEYAFCKTHLLIIDGKTKCVYRGRTNSEYRLTF